MCAGFGLIVCTCIIHTEVTESVCAGMSVCVLGLTDSVYMYNTY